MPKPNNQAQHEYLNKDESLGIEGITIYFKPNGKTKYKTHFYSILSKDNKQDGNIVYANTQIMFQDLRDKLDDGAKVGDLYAGIPKLEVLEDTNGCSVQYCCSNSLFMLHKLCAELDVVVDRAIDAEEHGKKFIDGYSGTDKTFAEGEFRSNVEYQPDDVDPLRQSVLFCHKWRMDRELTSYLGLIGRMEVYQK